MCGFGSRTGATTLAEIGDPHRFANPARLAAYAGLAPVDRQSGRSHTTGQPRRGNHRLHNAMFMAAFVATQHDPDARAHLPTQTRPRQGTQRRGHLRRPPTPQHHPGHAQDPNPLPTPPTRETTRRSLTTRQGHPPRVLDDYLPGGLRDIANGICEDADSGSLTDGLSYNYSHLT